MKTYLYPREQRRGEPILHFVAHDRYGYWLGTYYEITKSLSNKFNNLKYNGYGNEYNAVSRTRITLNLYQIFVGEAAFNRLMYKKKNEQSY